jgi:hypothetical protein
MDKIEIKRINSKWLINGKQYPDLSEKEKSFFDRFIIFMKESAAIAILL